MESSFLELKSKQVINTVDGKCLGHITDIIFDVVTSKALGFIVPGPNQGFWGLFKSSKELFIPFDCVCKLGVDAMACLVTDHFGLDRTSYQCKVSNNIKKFVSCTLI